MISCKKNKGFSLVELIVVIAIMAVMAAVLAPALLGYVEKSRMQKDNSAMDEVVNAVQLSLADEKVYDEILQYSAYDNVSCYVDHEDESQLSGCKISLKAASGTHKEQYMFNDNARLLDEVDYWVAGNMRGMTITFSPDKESSNENYDFEDGVINKFISRKRGTLTDTPELYNRLRSTVGDKLKTTSQTYRNSDYTIFIRVGSTGGNQAEQQDAIQVWGQYSGTNLDAGDNSFKMTSNRDVGEAGQNDKVFNDNNNVDVDVDHNSNVVQNGAKYVSVDGNTYEPGDELPELKRGDKYYYKDYYYTYYPTTDISDHPTDGWYVNTNVGDARDTLETMSNPLSYIREIPVTKMHQTYRQMRNLKEMPVIPDTVIVMSQTFDGCTALYKTTPIPNSVKVLLQTFYDCKSLKTPPTIPASVETIKLSFATSGITSLPNIEHCTQLKSMYAAFYSCYGLQDISSWVIPNSVVDMNTTFWDCKNITKAPVIPQSVSVLAATFGMCPNLSGTLVVNSTSLTSYDKMILQTKITSIEGSLSDELKSAIMATK